jgi:hypothetical protein
VKIPIKLFFFVKLSSMTWSQTRNAWTVGFGISLIAAILRNRRGNGKKVLVFLQDEQKMPCPRTSSTAQSLHD